MWEKHLERSKAKFSFFQVAMVLLIILAISLIVMRLKNSKQYIACGCGCCVDFLDPMEQCLYKSTGDDIKEIIKRDKKVQENCGKGPLVGCSRAVLYKYCD